MVGTKRILVSIGQISHVTMTISSFGSAVSRHPEVSSNSDCMVLKAAVHGVYLEGTRTIEYKGFH